jgi:hypothetical protein
MTTTDKPLTRMELENAVLSRPGLTGWRLAPFSEVWDHAFDLRKPRTVATDAPRLQAAMEAADIVLLKERAHPVFRIKGGTVPIAEGRRVCAIYVFNMMQATVLATWLKVGDGDLPGDPPDYEKALLDAMSRDADRRRDVVALILTLNGYRSDEDFQKLRRGLLEMHGLVR